MNPLWQILEQLLDVLAKERDEAVPDRIVRDVEHEDEHWLLGPQGVLKKHENSSDFGLVQNLGREGQDRAYSTTATTHDETERLTIPDLPCTEPTFA